MEETVIGEDQAAVEESIVEDASSETVTLNSIFQDESSSKKVIVQHSMDIVTDGAEGDQSGLPDLTDAVAKTSVGVAVPNPHSESEMTYEVTSESMEVATVDGNGVIDESVVEGHGEVVDGNETIDASALVEGGEYYTSETVQDIQVAEGSGEELIYLDSDVVKDPNVQFIEMAEANGGQEVVAVEDDLRPEPEVVETPTTNHKTKSVRVQMNRRPIATPTYISKEDVRPIRPTYLSRDDVKTRFLCPVCQKSFRQKHLLLCHIKLHDPTKPKSTSMYMSNCTTCGGNVRLTSEQARLLQERGTDDARIICSTCKLLGHDANQKQIAAPIELKPAYNFNCDICSCDIKLTDEQLQLVDQKGPENIRIICAPCSLKDQDLIASDQPKTGESNQLKCTSCQRIIIPSNSDVVDADNLTCPECQARNTVDSTVEDNYYTYNCSMCSKEMFLAEDPRNGAEIVCPECKVKQKQALSSSRVGAVKAVRDFPTVAAKVDGLAVMYKCNNCFCSMQVSEEQKELLRTRGVSGMKIICSACNAKEKIRPSHKRKMRSYQCDVCLNDMNINYVPSRDDDDIICQTCRSAEQRERLKKNKSDGHKCISCFKPLILTNFQLKKLVEKGIKPRIRCDDCKKSGESTGKYNKSSEAVDYRCDICRVTFGTSFDKFSNHFSAVHIPEGDFDKKTIRCPICNIGFKDRDNLKNHLFSHRPPGKRVVKMACPSCGESFAKGPMLKHYKSVHGVNAEVETFYFKSVDDFKSWKEEIEKSTCSKYMTGNGRTKAYVDRPSLMASFKCHWSVLYKSRLVGVEKSIFCPAKIDIHEARDGGYNVEFTKTHIGHDLMSLEYTEEEVDRMAAMLLENSSVEEIVTELSKGFEESSDDHVRIRQLLNDDQYSLSLKLGSVELVKKFAPRVAASAADELTSESDGETVDLPDALSWANDSLGATPSKHVTIDVDDGLLKLRLPNIVDSAVPFAERKLDVVRRLIDVLNKCSVPEHLDIVDVYLNPCEQTLIELTSGKRVEVVEDEDVSQPAEQSEAVASTARETNN